ncbi:nuclear protein Qri2/Nse4 [Penicillium taxi]|uniref:nuclear protein Qri2/Nse4 n=1 Tax=Penicillium taxi TaxID=168475 RepID=UPI0025459C08|nr:nuclear protein Qri2/Nse4 [Penicillium taxi]KAJ5908154.1 nuclear protein Qri2/Nse4 [Penicillium taxi]
MAPISLHNLDEPNAYNSTPPSSPDTSPNKENRRHHCDKRHSVAEMSQSSKRRRFTDRTSNIHSQSSSSQQQRRQSNRYYDPDQDEGERREIRKGLRDLTRDLNDSRSEFMRSGNKGIYETVEKANKLFAHVKQTADATIDSRLLVNAADLSHKKTAQLTLGSSAAGIDVDEFVSKCISFMRHGPGGSMPSGGSRRNRMGRLTQRDNDSGDEDDGDAMNWEWLGRTACFPHNARPPVSGWLLGPLSVQKRVRQVVQRRQNENFSNVERNQPKDLAQEDLGQETANLTTMCSNVNQLLANHMADAQDKVDTILSAENPTEDRVQEVMADCKIADDGGTPLFQFCINPKSFGQTIENLFYVSFLVRDGIVGVATDSRNLPTLHSSDPYAPSEAQKRGVEKHQAVFSLDFDTWEKLIEEFKITESIIPHREEEDAQTGLKWYG